MSYYIEYKLNGKRVKRHFEDKDDADDIKKELKAMGAESISSVRY